MKIHRITGVFATEKYLPEPRLPKGGLLRLRADLADFSRVAIGAVSYHLNHNFGEVVGKVVEAWYEPGEGYRFVAHLPLDDDEPIQRVVNYIREFDQGIRGRFSPGYRVTRVEPAGRSANGIPLYDGAWMLTEISDMTVPADTDAVADVPAEMVALRGFGDGWITPEALAAITEQQRSTEEETAHMTIPELIADLQRQLAEGIISDADALLLQELKRQLDDGFAGVRMDGDDGSDDGDKEGEGERAAEVQTREGGDDAGDGEGERAAEVQTREGGEGAGEGERATTGQRPSGAALGQHFRTALKGRRSLPRTNVDGKRSLQSVNIHPEGRVPRHDDLAGLDLGMYFRALSDPNKFRVAAKRELAWMDRNLGHGFQRSIDDGSYIPFSLLANHGPKALARASQRALAGVSPEQHLESYFPLAEQTYRSIQEHLNGYSERALTTADTSAGAATSSITDIAHSIMWLTEQDRALEMMTVLPGLEGQWQGFYGNANPAEDWVDEAGDLTETTPTLAQVKKLPKTMGMYWSISTAERDSADTPIAAMIEEGCEKVFRTKAMRAFLSGTGVGAAFAADAKAITGLMNSGITETGFGAAIANLDRDDMVDARRRLFANEVDMTDLGWILSNSVATALEKKRIGGTESVRFVYEDGQVDSGAERIPAREPSTWGKPPPTIRRCSCSAARPSALIWGAGIAFNALQLPGKTKVEYDLQINCNFAFLNAKRATVIKKS